MQKQNGKIKIKSNSVDKLPTHDSSALYMCSPVSSPLLLQPLALPLGPRPPLGCCPVRLSHLGQPAQEAARRKNLERE